MDEYRKLRGLLSLAREIDRQDKILSVQTAPTSFGDRDFPAEFTQVVAGERELPSLEELREMRPRPHHVFDAVVLKRHCERRISERFSQDGQHVSVELEVIQE